MEDLKNRYIAIETQLEGHLTGIAPFDKAHEVTKQPRARVAFALVGAVVLLVVLNIGARLITNLVGFVLPAYWSFKALETEGTDDDKQWLTYWVVYASFSIAETFADILLYWIPFYYVAKLAFLIWLMHPSTRGSVTLYDRVIRTFLKEHEQRIDGSIGAAAAKASAATASVSKIASNHQGDIAASLARAANKTE